MTKEITIVPITVTINDCSVIIKLDTLDTTTLQKLSTTTSLEDIIDISNKLQ